MVLDAYCLFSFLHYRRYISPMLHIWSNGSQNARRKDGQGDSGCDIQESDRRDKYVSVRDRLDVLGAFSNVYFCQTATKERLHERTLRETLEASLLTALHPRTSIRITLQVLTDDGGVCGIFILGLPSTAIATYLRTSTLADPGDSAKLSYPRPSGCWTSTPIITRCGYMHDRSGRAAMVGSYCD